MHSRGSIGRRSRSSWCPGGNFPTMSFVPAWEREFGKPVVTTNQAALWAMMGIMGVSDPLPGLGRLLEEMPKR